jgi:hypothetical protein
MALHAKRRLCLSFFISPHFHWRSFNFQFFRVCLPLLGRHAHFLEVPMANFARNPTIAQTKDTENTEIQRPQRNSCPRPVFRPRQPKSPLCALCASQRPLCPSAWRSTDAMQVRRTGRADEGLACIVWQISCDLLAILPTSRFCLRR